MHSPFKLTRTAVIVCTIILALAALGIDRGRAYFSTVPFATFTTIANGNWSSPATWAGGLVPPFTITAADTVNIGHVVTYDLTNDLEVFGVVNITNGTFRTALSGNGMNRSVFIRTGGKWNMTNSEFYLPLFSCGYGCTTGSNLSGNFINQNGMITIINSRVEVAQNWEDASDPNGGMRTITGGCLTIGENFANKGSVDLYDAACIQVGLHGSGNFKNEYQITFQNSVTLKLVGNGNFENVGSGPGILGGPGSPDIANLGIANGNLLNDRPWSAQVLNFCIAGGSVSGSMAADFTSDVTNNDTPAACTAVNGAMCTNCVAAAPPNPILTKSFSPTTFVNGGFTTLTFTITNTAPGAVAQTGLAFTDTLPSSLRVATPPNIVGACGGTVTAAAGGTTISLSGGMVAAGGTCSFSVNVTNVPGELNPSCMGNPPAFTDSAGNISGLSPNLNNGVQPSCVTVTAPLPVLTKSFSPTTFVNGGFTTLTFTITNTAMGSVAQTGLAFTDTLPSSLRVRTPPNIVGACGGTVTAVAGGTTISLSGGMVAAGGTCSFSVDVTNVLGDLNPSCGANPPAFTNSATNISGLSPNLMNGVQPSCVIVTGPNPTLTKSFSPTTFVNGGFTTLTFTIDNTVAGATNQTGLGFTDTLPSSLRVRTPPNIVGACGGTVTAVGGGTTISLSGGTVAAGGTCSFSVDVTNVLGEVNASCDNNPAAFTNTAGNISGLSPTLNNGVMPSCVIVTAPNPVLTKSFSPTTFVNGGFTTLTFTITNTAVGSVARTGLAFTDTLPSSLRVANPPNIVGACGGTVTAVAGGTTIMLSGGSVAAGGTCSFSVNVTNVPGELNASCMENPPAFTNSAGNISGLSPNLDNGVQPSCVTVTAPNPTLTKSFNPTTFVNGGFTTLTFTINNTAPGAVARTGLAFTDTLPSGLRVATPPNIVGACGGTVTAVAGGTTISLSGGSVAAGVTCSFSVNVTNVPGMLNPSCDGNPPAFTNSATNISGLSPNLDNGVQPSCVTVTAPNPVLTKSFSPTTFVNGGFTTLTFTITNTAMGATNQTGLGFTDTLPSSLRVRTPPNIVGACGGTVTAVGGGTTISLSGGTVAAGATCSFSVDVTNVLGEVNASCAGNPPAFTDSATNISGLSPTLNNGVQPSCVIVTAPNPVLTKSFSPTTFVNGGFTTLTFTITNTAVGAVARTGLAFTDTLPSSLRVADPPTIVGACGGTVAAVAGGTTISLSGGSVAASGTCSFSVNVTNVLGALNPSCAGNPPAFTDSAANISGLSPNLDNGVQPSCVTVTAPNPTLTKSFNPTTFVNGGFTTLTFTINNTAVGAAAQTGLAFTDTLPSGLRVATPPNIVGACGGTVTAVAGGTTISLSGGSVAAGVSCSFSVNVTNVPGMLNPSCTGNPPAFTNSAGNISGLSPNLDNGVQPSCVTVTAPLPVLTKSFSPTTIADGGTTTLTFTINNTAAGSTAQTGLAFTDTLPSGLRVATPPNIVGSCGGTVTAVAGGTTISLSGGSVAAGGTCTIAVNVTNVPGQFNASCAGNPPAFTNSAGNISGLSSNLVNGVQPSCVIVTGPGSPKGPGLPFPDTSEVSDQKAGSVLFYNIYTSNAASPQSQNTRICITNISSNEPVAVHLFFVDGATCSIADAIICLTKNQTACFLASDLDPGVTGYLVAIASDPITGCPINFNCLIGDEYVKFASGHQANLGAEAFSAIAATPVACDGFSVTATLAFNGVSYNRVPRTLAASSIPARADGNDTLLILNRFGGNLAIGAATLFNIFGILYDDAENALSFAFNPGTCQFRSSLSNSFPRTTPRFENFIPAGRSGWARFFSTSDIGLLGSIINFNPNAGASANAFNQGRNLHKLTLTDTQTLVIPIFPPGCID